MCLPAHDPSYKDQSSSVKRKWALPLYVIRPAQKVKQESFQSDIEAEEWSLSKFAEFQDPDHPPRVHESNWKLCEYWYRFDRGLETPKSASVEDNYARSSNDLSSSMLALNMPEQGKAKRSLADLHKSSLTKVKSLSTKLSRHLMSCESSLPGVKRKVGMATYNRLKKGLDVCREARTSVMDEMEDLKEIDGDQGKQQDTITQLNKLAKTLQEHSDALMEAFNNYQKVEMSGVKKDHDAEGDGDSRAAGKWRPKVG